MPLLRPREAARLPSRHRTGRQVRKDRGKAGRRGRERRRRKWILIPLILFMLITPLSPAKDFHNNGLVPPLNRERRERAVRGRYRRKIVDVGAYENSPRAPGSGITPAALGADAMFPLFLSLSVFSARRHGNVKRLNAHEGVRGMDVVRGERAYEGAL